MTDTGGPFGDANARNLNAKLAGIRKAQEVLDAGGSQEDAVAAFNRAAKAQWSRSFLSGLGIPDEHLGYLDS